MQLYLLTIALRSRVWIRLGGHNDSEQVDSEQVDSEQADSEEQFGVNCDELHAWLVHARALIKL